MMEMKFNILSRTTQGLNISTVVAQKRCMSGAKAIENTPLVSLLNPYTAMNLIIKVT